MANGFAYGMSLYAVRLSNGETVTLLARDAEQARSLSIYTHSDLEIISVEKHQDPEKSQELFSTLTSFLPTPLHPFFPPPCVKPQGRRSIKVIRINMKSFTFIPYFYPESEDILELIKILGIIHLVEG